MTVVNTQALVMPSSPADRKAILDSMGEISASMTRKEAESTFIKEAISDLNQKFNIPKKLLNRFARDFHKSAYSESLGANSDYETLVETLVGGETAGNHQVSDAE